MANLLESIPYQPIEEDTEEKSLFWAETALPLVRKVFADIESGKVESGKVAEWIMAPVSKTGVP